MKKLLFAGAIGLVLLGALARPACAITGGEPDGDRHPNVGAIVIQNPTNGAIRTISGTLIHPRVLLTAGHVVEFIESGRVRLLGVSFDSEVNVEDPTTWLPVSDVASIFTGFSADPREIDIGALILAEPVVGITPANLPAVGFLDDLRATGELGAGDNASRFTVVGYGMVMDWPPPNPYWQEPPTRNMAQSGFRTMNDGWLFLSQNQALGFGGTVQGDSGGPTFWTDPETGRQTLVSITSWGDLANVATGISFRIDTEVSLAFIDAVLDSLEE